MLDQLREGDTVAVRKRDRLLRSLKDLLHIMEQMAEAGAGFRSVTAPGYEPESSESALAAHKRPRRKISRISGT
jgi:DNA invertase Pin-like site-specific DNA recombinase